MESDDEDDDSEDDKDDKDARSNDEESVAKAAEKEEEDDKEEEEEEDYDEDEEDEEDEDVLMALERKGGNKGRSEESNVSCSYTGSLLTITNQLAHTVPTYQLVSFLTHLLFFIIFNRTRIIRTIQKMIPMKKCWKPRKLMRIVATGLEDLENAVIRARAVKEKER